MINLTSDYKQEVIQALLQSRHLFTGSDSQFAKQYGISGSIYSRLKNGEQPEGLLRESKFLEIGQKLSVNISQKKWNVVQTDVYAQIKEAVLFCQAYSKSMMLVDDAGIGKTFTAKHLSKTLQNCFYIDGSQCKTAVEFVRLLARTIGVDDKDKVIRVKAQIKYSLKILPYPIVIIDESGDLDDKTFLIIKELWNDTEGQCGWYMMGAEGLQRKIERNISNKKPGFTELFSRFGEKYGHVTPFEKSEKQHFYKKLITDVISANAPEDTNINMIVKKCLTNDSGKISGLRRAESLLLIN
jgi:hypothetical protein